MLFRETRTIEERPWPTEVIKSEKINRMNRKDKRESCCGRDDCRFIAIELEFPHVRQSSIQLDSFQVSD